MKRWTSAVLVASLYLLELAAVLAALALYKKNGRPLGDFLHHSAGTVFLAALAMMAVSLPLLVGAVRIIPPPRGRLVAAPVFLNLLSLVVAFTTAEIALRLLSKRTPAGTTFGSTLLLPRSWRLVAANHRATLKGARSRETYLVADSALGWTIGPNRRSRDYNRALARQVVARLHRDSTAPALADDADIYLSSAEGIRSPRVGMSFAPTPTQHRVALVGDSFTFGLEVPYEGTWGAQLEHLLGAPYHVLNFGVDGYGVDQAYLRYRRDVAPWHPQFVILGIIDDDLRRTMCVYGFLCFPGFEMPFAKPRLIGARLEPANLPLIRPDSIFAARSISELPAIVHDGSYDPAEWQWHLYDHSYAARLVLTRFRRWPAPRPTITEQAMDDVNGAVIREFLRLARQNGSTPLVVFFPSLTEFLPGHHAGPGDAIRLMEAQHIPYVDMTACVRRVPAERRFVTLHYSAATNAAIATCLRDEIGKPVR